MSLPLDPDAPPVPLTVIGGYLGAGKTTLLAHLLSSDHGVRLAVIVNDVGEVGIDAALLGELGTDGIVDLPNGCVCCSLGGELLDALRMLLERSPRPDHIIIEASGVADPAVPAAWSTVPPLRPGGVIVCAAADHIASLLRSRHVAPEVRRQLAAADLVALTKVDMADDDALVAVRALVDEASGSAPIVEVTNGVLPAEVLLDPPVIGSGADASSPMHHDDGPSGYRTWTWTSEEPVDGDHLKEFAIGLLGKVARVKGRVRLIGMPHRHEVQGVGRGITIVPVVDDTADGSTLVFVARADLVDEQAAASLVP